MDLQLASSPCPLPLHQSLINVGSSCCNWPHLKVRTPILLAYLDLFSDRLLVRAGPTSVEYDVLASD